MIVAVRRSCTEAVYQLGSDAVEWVPVGSKHRLRADAGDGYFRNATLSCFCRNMALRDLTLPHAVVIILTRGGAVW